MSEDYDRPDMSKFFSDEELARMRTWCFKRSPNVVLQLCRSSGVEINPCEARSIWYDTLARDLGFDEDDLGVQSVQLWRVVTNSG